MIKVVYIHVAKTGGKSFEKSLNKYGLTRPYGNAHKHSTALHHIINNGKAYPIIATIRNPFSRTVSLYNYLKSSPNYKNVIGSFSDFVYNPKGYGHCFDHLDRNPLTMDTWLKDLNGNVIVDDVVRMEYMQEDWSKIHEKYNLPKTIDRYTESRDGMGKNYMDYYNSDLIQYIGDICKWELQTYGYTV
jgi:hypothetical protein